MHFTTEQIQTFDFESNNNQYKGQSEPRTMTPAAMTVARVSKWIGRRTRHSFRLFDIAVYDMITTSQEETKENWIYQSREIQPKKYL